MWPGPGCCLSVSARCHSAWYRPFYESHNHHNLQPQRTQNRAREGSVLIKLWCPLPHLYRIRHTHLRGEGWTLSMSGLSRLLCDHPLWAELSRGEGHGKGSEYPMSSACIIEASQHPHNYLQCYRWWHLSLSPSRSLFPDLPRTVIKIWWAHNL